MSQQPNEARSALLQLIEVDEAERRHVAHVLHSGIGQSLTAALLSLQFFAESGLPADEIEGVADSVRDALQQVRALSLRLRPPLLDEIGLGAALASTLEQIGLQRGFSVEVDTRADSQSVSGWLAISLFRWMQALAELTPASCLLRVRLQVEAIDTALLDAALVGATAPEAWRTESAARARILDAQVEERMDGVSIRIAPAREGRPRAQLGA
ncbi:histidine kinase [uncultured Aquimonas sp.]|jgi:signal transduction histidine kinase|uniref:histidine kinase n=1 Tax=uncultured Aquimonas sp. TaxID=385483 RepID=UPI00086B78A0|nr:histidine kinase [uncultured Aquimonas sp.]ODU44769.1 MAG: hypothetical protein ABS96_15395 [Xanthomonadaceae bacterium SCN 69-123]